MKHISPSRAVLVLAAALAAACARPAHGEPTRAAAASPSAVVLRVNGTPITRAEVERVQGLMLSSFPKQHKATPEMERQAQEAAREKLVEMALLHEVARKSPPADLEARVAAQLAERKGRYQTQKAYENALATTRMSEAELEDFTRKEVLIAAHVEREFTSKAKIDDGEVKAFYEKNRDGFKTMEESRRVSHVLVGLDASRATPEQKKAAQVKAEALRARIARGESLAEVARKESSCPSASQGGDLSWIQRGQMAPPFERAAFGMKKGELSPVVATPLGYHVIRVADVKDAEYAPLDKASDRIRAHLKAEATKRAVAAWLAGERAKARIERPAGEAR